MLNEVTSPRTPMTIRPPTGTVSGAGRRSGAAAGRRAASSSPAVMRAALIADIFLDSPRLIGAGIPRGFWTDPNPPVLRATRSRHGAAASVSVYLLRRCLAAVPLLLGILTLIFLLLHLVPGRPFVLEPGAGARPGAADHLRELFGTDRPLLERYLGWLGGVARGDLGVSWSLRVPVARAVAEAMVRTVVLAGAAIVLQFALGTAAGLAAAASRGPVDRLV